MSEENPPSPPSPPLQPEIVPEHLEYVDRMRASSHKKYVIVDDLALGRISVIYGVCLRYNTTHGSTYALKMKQRESRRRGILNMERAEIHALKVLRNERHVVNILDLVKLKGDLLVVMELAVVDMATVARKKPHIMITDIEKKTIMHQFLRGVAAIHRNGLIHRDIKPSNLLIMANGLLKVSDFGDSTPHASALKGKKLSPHAGSTYYKAPEVLFGDEQFDEKVDIWAVGCSMAELYLRRIAFQGSNKINRCQIEEIMKVCGFFNDREWPKLASLRWYAHFRRLFGTLAINRSLEVAMEITGEDEVASDFICGLLAKYPQQRPSAKFAIKHCFLKGRHPNVKTLLERLKEAEVESSSSDEEEDEEEEEISVLIVGREVEGERARGAEGAAEGAAGGVEGAAGGAEGAAEGEEQMEID